MKIIASYHSKGGVGKTATAVNLAYTAAQAGARVLLWDMDPQGAASYYFRIKPKVKRGAKSIVRGKTLLATVIKGTDFPGLDLIPADLSFRKIDLHLDRTKRPKRGVSRVLEGLKHDYDYVFLDCAPALSLVAENVFRSSHLVVSPLIPTTLSLRAHALVLRCLGKVRRPPPVLCFFSMVDRRKKLHRETLADSAALGDNLLSTYIPYASQVELMGVHRAPLAVFAPRSEAAKGYRQLWEELRAHI